MRKIFSLALLFLFSVMVYGQTRKEWLAYADAAFENRDYSSAAYYYQKVIDPGTHHSRDYIFPYVIRTWIPPLDSTRKDSASVPTPVDSTQQVPKNITQRIGYDYVVHQIATCYRLMRDYEKAETWYAKAVQQNIARYPEDKLYYGYSLMENQKYKEALSVFESIGADTLSPDKALQKMAKTGALSCYFALDSNSFKPATKIKILDTVVNSPKATATFASGFYGDNLELVVTSARGDSKVKDPKNKLENPYYLCDLYTIQKQDNSWSSPKNLDAPINTPWHEGAGVLSINRDMFFFTRWNPENPKECFIYLTRFMNGRWLEPMKLPSINLEGYRSMQPSLNQEEDKLFFASDRPGGKGGMDIWYCEIDENGNPGNPNNVGSNINTPGNEFSPFYHSKTTTLYFASNGHVGLGGLDIFKSYGTETDTVWSAPVNMKAPINSSKDDAYFIIQNDQKTAYFSSDRDRCVGCDPVSWCYKIYEVEKNPPFFNISGTVYNATNNEPIPNALVTFKDVLGNLQPFFFITNEKGYYETPLPQEFEFFIKAQKNKFFGDAASISTLGKTESEDFVQDFYLTPIPAGEIVIPGIEYDFDKATLRPRSKEILDSLAMFLELNNNLVVQINSHTDFRGSDSYNLQLSKERAKSCVDYLISKGIAPERLFSEGFGETAPFVMPDGTVLTEQYINGLRTTDLKEAAHQRNRRTSFNVVKEGEIRSKK
jgi:OmpA-OmpF porin, OOP family